MKFLPRRLATPRAVRLSLFAALGVLLPSTSMAAEGENVTLNFSSGDRGWLLAALIVGIAAILFGLVFLRRYVMRQSPGNERMQEVGLAIRLGALAYLRKQIGSMLPFIVLLAIGLFALYYHLGAGVASGVALCFALGVLASYLSGYAGMLMAVAGNMRTANAALTTYRGALLVAFRSGAVAGMVTVGVGLVGATAILLIAPQIATNLLVGFGFGASLAALFMRVGGGIFTKAADVGADLVGKVEAGIPEDDPRNPAVIADNVGDNVGDCAGMAADVFESFEVTLVAAIVLGAATASVFDSQTWPRLVVFGLMAAAAGLLASMVGVSLVDAKESIDADPLKSLKRGFNIAAVLSLALTAVLAYFTMGGQGTPIEANRLISPEARVLEEAREVQSVAKRIAKSQGKAVTEVAPSDIAKDPSLRGFQFTDADNPLIQQIVSANLNRVPAAPDLSGFHRVTNFQERTVPTGSETKVSPLDYAVQVPNAPGAFGQASTPQFVSLADYFGGSGNDQVVFARVHMQGTRPANPAQGYQPARPEEKVDRVEFRGPVKRSGLDALLGTLRQQEPTGSTVKYNIEGTSPAQLYVDDTGAIIVGATDFAGKALSQVRQLQAPTIYAATPARLQALIQQGPSAQSSVPPRADAQVALVESHRVPWYAFWLAIAFGVAMAFAIEFITDYYVSTRKRPTQEVAGVATAGAAPMVIQGFAHASTSSVFMVLAIVVALLFPLFIFDPTMYGGYTLSFYGIALVGLGLLTSTAYVLAMDTFGPISDNAQGVYEMSGAHLGNAAGATIVGRLDAAGNTTKALTKGFAIATAVVAAVALFHSYLDGAQLNGIGLRLDVPEIFLGLLIGGAAPYLFSAFAINAVGRSSFELINEVRRQFREDAGIMAGTSKPDYARCVAIVTAAAQRELLSPGILAIALPLAVGFGFSIGKPTTEIGGHTYNLTGAQALGGFLAGAIVSGQLMAVLLANSGGMWDNAKKLIEDGLHGGKGTEAHKASVVGDTIGDPFKDTAGPALNPLIKVMNLVALLVSGVIVQPMGDGVRIGVTLVCIAALTVSFWLSRRGSMSESFQAAAAQATVQEIPMAASTSVELPQGGQTITPPAPTNKRKLFVEEDE